MAHTSTTVAVLTATIAAPPAPGARPRRPAGAEVAEVFCCRCLL